MNGIESIAAERQRQMDVKGWTPKHDDEHTFGEISLAAACYALGAGFGQSRGEHPTEREIDIDYRYDHFVRLLWPWDTKWLKFSSERRDLVKAGALIAAEIDRLDRSTKEGQG